MDIKSKRIHLNLSCLVCYEDYNLQGNQPRILNCGHTVCTSCVEKLFEVNFNYIRCPFDKTLIKYLRTSLIPKNYVLFDELLAKEESLGCKDHDHLYRFYCKTEGLFKCQDCVVVSCLYEKHDLAAAEEYSLVIPLRGRIMSMIMLLNQRKLELTKAKVTHDENVEKLKILQTQGPHKTLYTPRIIAGIESIRTTKLAPLNQIFEKQDLLITNSIAKIKEYNQELQEENWRGLRETNIDKMKIWIQELEDALMKRPRFSPTNKTLNDQAFETTQQYLNEQVWTLLEGKPHQFKWRYEGNQVQVTGDWCKWQERFDLKLINGVWVSDKILIRRGRNLFKFIVDGNWCFDICDYNCESENNVINNFIQL